MATTDYAGSHAENNKKSPAEQWVMRLENEVMNSVPFPEDFEETIKDIAEEMRRRYLNE